MRLLEFFRPFRVVISRRVSEEEQISVESFCRTTEIAQQVAHEFLSAMRDHRKRSNEEVVLATRQQLASLDTAMQQRGDQIHLLDQELATKRAEIFKLDNLIKDKRRRLGIAEAPAPKPNGAA